jgi:hypothetical protein
MKRKTLIAILVVAVFCPLAVFAGYKTGAKTSRRAPAFTLRGKTTHFLAGGSTRVEQVTRYESGDNSWRQVRVSEGVVSEQFFRQGSGFFRVDHAKRVLVPNHATAKTRDKLLGATAAELLGSPQFNRTEVLLGYTAYVVQIRDGDILMSEAYVIPELGNTAVKYVSFDAAGRVISVDEPESITLGEPSAADLRGPDYPEAPSKEARSGVR